MNERVAFRFEAITQRDESDIKGDVIGRVGSRQPLAWRLGSGVDRW